MRAQFSDRVFCLQILFYSCVATVWNFHLHLLGVWVLWQLFLLLSNSTVFLQKKKIALVWGSVSFYDDRREKCTLVLIEELTASARKPSSTHSEFCFYGFSNLFFAIKLFFPCVACFLLSFFSVQFFFYQIQNWKLIRIIIKILKEGIFYFILIMQASCLLSHFVKSLYFVRKKIPTFWKISIKFWFWHEKTLFRVT